MVGNKVVGNAALDITGYGMGWYEVEEGGKGLGGTRSGML